MAILRTAGSKLLIWGMLRSWYRVLSVSRPCLGSQGPGGGVVLGFDSTLVIFCMFQMWKFHM